MRIEHPELMPIPKMMWTRGKRHIYWVWYRKRDYFTMDVVRAIVENIDCNAPWLRVRLDYGDWCESIARKATADLRATDEARRFGTPSNSMCWRLYPYATVRAHQVHDVVSRIQDMVGIALYTEADSECAPMYMEQALRCPHCLRWMRLFWKIWMPKKDEPDPWTEPRYNLQWGCINPKYKTECINEIERWPNKCPEFLYQLPNAPVFFHNWLVKDGVRQPESMYRLPVTQYTDYWRRRDTTEGMLPKQLSAESPSTGPLLVIGGRKGHNS